MVREEKVVGKRQTPIQYVTILTAENGGLFFQKGGQGTGILQQFVRILQSKPRQANKKMS